MGTVGKAWTAVLLLAALGFAGWAIVHANFVLPGLASASPTAEILNWIGFTVAVGFAGLPWVLGDAGE